MPENAQERRRLHARAAIESRYRPDAPETLELRQQLREQNLAEHIRRVVDAAPPLSDDQLDRLAALLRPTAATRTAGVA